MQHYGHFHSTWILTLLNSNTTDMHHNTVHRHVFAKSIDIIDCVVYYAKSIILAY